MEDQKDRCPTNQRHRIRIKQVLAQYNQASIFLLFSIYFDNLNTFSDLFRLKLYTFSDHNE